MTSKNQINTQTNLLSITQFGQLIYRYNNFILLLSLLILIVFLFFVTDNISVVSAAEIVRKPVLSAEQLQLIERANLLAEKITKPDEKLSKLFELLAFESQFDDKQHAQKTIQLILKQIAVLEAGALKNNFYELLALAQSNIGDYKQINVTLNHIAQSVEKAQIQFDLAEKIFYEKEDAKLPVPNEVTDLLNLAYAGAGIAKDTGLEALAAMQLGRVLAKAGKIEEAKKFLNITLQKSDELAEAEAKNLKQSVLRILVQNKLYAEAMTEIAKTKSQESKDLFLGLVLQTLAENGQIDDAKKGLERIKLVDLKDTVVIAISREIAKKGTVAELVDLLKLMSSDERKEIFVQNTISFLLGNKRPDVAVQLIDQAGVKADKLERCNLILIANLIDEKKFDEAGQKIAAISNADYKMQMSRYLILSLIRAKGLAAVVGKVVLNYTDAEMRQVAALNAEAGKLSAIADNVERAKAAFSLLLKQTEVLNPDGIFAVTRIVWDEVDKLDNPAQILEYQYNTARLHFELGNFDGVRESLNRSVKYLDGVKDLTKLKELVLYDHEGTAATNNVTINNTDADKTNPAVVKVAPAKIAAASEAMIKERLFLTYTSICAMYIDINDIEIAKKIYEKSKQYLAPVDDEPIRQFDQTGILSKLLLQLDSAETVKSK
ncbi:MAG: hypothetical protein LBT09_12500 [Planctomycetaceae bacterium]|jgi:tetratricopeptide (TPR) repeat protein|nr:hypothetical protein [Planctomycetaceae bacterium]